MSIFFQGNPMLKTCKMVYRCVNYLIISCIFTYGVEHIIKIKTLFLEPICWVVVMEFFSSCRAPSPNQYWYASRIACELYLRA